MLKIFNLITKSKEYFYFPKDKNIKIYVCGITPYNYVHAGHARTFLIFDIIIRYFIYIGYRVIYIRNITDIDDKIIKVSKEKNTNFANLTNYFITNYKKLFKKLNIIEPNFEPKVTKNINYIIKTINILINNNNAYIDCNNNILFNINSYKKYGIISNRIINNNLINNKKKNFILWKKNKNNEPYWNSPWGRGRPGWHIECTSISNLFLKDRIDIHGGGIDLLFPHHENELAQTSCAYKDFKIKNWVHVGTVNFLSKKISKSKKEYITLNYLLKNFNSDVVRYSLTKKNYRKPLELNIKNMNNDSIIINKIYKLINNFNLNNNIKEKNKKTEFTKIFFKAINDDFNTPKMYSIIFNMSKEITKINKKKFNLAKELTIEMINLSSILGIFQNNKNNYKNINIKKNVKKI